MPLSQQAQHLIDTGWKRIREIHRDNTTYVIWDHPDHQHSRRGFYTTTEAVYHQKMLDKGRKCSCLPHNGGDLRDKPLEIQNAPPRN